MKELKIRFFYDEELSFSQFSNTIFHMNRAINLSKRLDSAFAEKLNAVDEFSKYDLSESYRQINENEKVRDRKYEPILIQKITTNSPIEITINNNPININLNLNLGEIVGGFFKSIFFNHN